MFPPRHSLWTTLGGRRVGVGMLHARPLSGPLSLHQATKSNDDTTAVHSGRLFPSISPSLWPVFAILRRCNKRPVPPMRPPSPLTHALSPRPITNPLALWGEAATPVLAHRVVLYETVQPQALRSKRRRTAVLPPTLGLEATMTA